MEKPVRWVRYGVRIEVGRHSGETHEDLAGKIGLTVTGRSPNLALVGEFGVDEVDMGLLHEKLGIYGSSESFGIPRGVGMGKEGDHPARIRTLELWETGKLKT